MDLVWLAAFIVRLQVSNYSHLSDHIVQLQIYRIINEKQSTYAPITIGKIVIIMIKWVISIFQKKIYTFHVQMQMLTVYRPLW